MVVSGTNRRVDDGAALVLGLHLGVGALGKVQRGDQVEANDRFGEARRCRRGLCPAVARKGRDGRRSRN